ncbi:MAG: HEAT repeat domain-containing protein [Desulfosalsimonas sp.]
MKRLVFPAAVLTGGLALSHVLFTILVYISNIGLYAELEALQAAGYLVVPNEKVIQGLGSITPALYGALFFTFTAGAALSLAGFFAAWLKIRIFSNSRIYKTAAAALWLGGAAACNLRGWNPGFTLVFLLVPAAVFFFTQRKMPEKKPGDGYLRAAHLIAVTAAALGWLSCMQHDVFLDIRDRVLLSNPAGQQVNEFYYAYTLYPAQMIKPPAGRLINAFVIEGGNQKTTCDRVVRQLAEFDWLLVLTSSAVELTVRCGSSDLEFAGQGTAELKVPADDFFSNPGRILEKFSQQSDDKQFLRRFTFAGLISAFPLTLYMFLHAGLCLVLWFIKSIPARSAAASGICLCLAIVFLLPFYGEENNITDQKSIKTSLKSENWYVQRNALKAVARKNLDPPPPGISRELAGSPHVPVRYWLARVLGNSRHPGARNMLITMTDDPSPNVSCMAYAGLGGTGDAQSAEFILNRIKEIDHWYVQQYAYKALKKLGWKQSLLNTNGNLLH